MDTKDGHSYSNAPCPQCGDLDGCHKKREITEKLSAAEKILRQALQDVANADTVEEVQDISRKVLGYDPNAEYEIYINASKFKVKGNLSYAEIKELAYPGSTEKYPKWFPTCVYSKAFGPKREGQLIYYESVLVQDGTYIDIIGTGNA